MQLVDIWRAGMFWCPNKYGLNGTAKIIRFAHHIDVMHKRCAPMPHYYLFLIGVDPKQRMKGLCSALMREMFNRTDIEGVPVYLETQSAGNVEIYKKHGFELVEAHPFPSTPSICNWGMIRKPRPVRT